MKFFYGIILCAFIAWVPHTGATGRFPNVGRLVRYFESALSKEFLLETEEGRRALQAESELLPARFRASLHKEFLHLAPKERELAVYLRGLHIESVRKRSMTLYREIEAFGKSRKLSGALRDEERLQRNPFRIQKKSYPQSEWGAEFSEANQALGRRELINLFSELKQDVRACMSTRSNASLSSLIHLNWRQALWSVGYSEFMTLTSYVTATGVKKISARDLLMSMGVSGASAVVGPFLFSSTNSFFVRYFQGVAFGEGRAAFDFVFYKVVPEFTQNSFDDYKVESRKRFEFNAEYEAKAAIVPVALHTLLSMVECLSPTTQTFRATYGVRALSNWGMGFYYFGLWNRFKKDQFESQLGNPLVD